MVFAVVMLVFVGFAIAITIRPVNIIALSFAIYAFEQWAQANSAYFGIHSALINFGFGLLAIYAMICLILRGQNPLTPPTQAMLVWLALYLLAAVSCLWSTDRSLSMFLFKYNLPYVVTFVGIVPLVIQDRDDIRKGFIMSLAFGTIVMLLLLSGTHIHAWGRTIEVASGTGVVDRVGKMRTRLAPLSVAEFAGHMLIITVMMNFRGKGRVWQVLRWVIVVLAMTLIYRSGSRGQLIACLFVVVMFIALSRGTKRIFGWVAACASVLLIVGVAAWAFAGMADNGRRWNLDYMKSDYAATRLEGSAKLLEFWMESSPITWVFGLGSSASYDNRILGHYCHITAVEVLAELGFVGFTLLVAFGIVVGRDMLRLYTLTKNSDVDRGVAVALCCLFAYAFLLSFKQGSFLTNTALFGSGLMIGRHTAIMRQAYQREHVREMQRWNAYYAQLSQAYQSPSPQT